MLVWFGKNCVAEVAIIIPRRGAPVTKKLYIARKERLRCMFIFYKQGFIKFRSVMKNELL